ncbi:hypothetical protein DFJ77DRAFT_310326 [Powellomyces hirtus]|nr:hypothetical protein DFJ77DRAFT_310326 [Powellomyces hirtus]
MSKRTLDDVSTPDSREEGSAGKKSKLQRENDNNDSRPVSTQAGQGPTITKAEADLYDRQIRLWGLEAQQRMRHAKILVAGVSGLSNEICKNLVLSGVGAITIISDGTVEIVDLGAQLFLRETDIGKNKAEAIAPRVQALNPRVHVEARNTAIGTLSDEFFADFAVVCLCNADLKEMLRVDNICREGGKKFYAADTAGMMGCILCDLSTHKFIETSKSSEKEDAVTTTTEKTISHPRIGEALRAKWGVPDLKALTRQQMRTLKSASDPVYFAFNVLWIFREKMGRLPTAADTDLKALFAMRDTYMNSVECDAAYLPDDMLRSFAQTAGAELSAVCAILGGFAAQDILKVLSGKDAPLDNYFAFDGTEFSGKLLKLPPPPIVMVTPAAAAPVETVDLD